MIKMSVYYPADGGSKFDHDYYRTHHMPLIQERLGDACLRYEIERALRVANLEARRSSSRRATSTRRAWRYSRRR